LKQGEPPEGEPEANVRLDNPLKQGLKLVAGAVHDAVLAVRLDNPLKQGLKLGIV